MLPETYRDKVRGALIGAAMGDALGMPVETWTRDDIRGEFGRVTGYMDSRSKWARNLKQGQWTDDTKLTLAIVKGFSAAISRGELDLDSIRKAILDEHLIAIAEHADRGFGKSTRVALKDRAEGRDPFDGRHPKRPGNGCAMKSAPLGLAFALRNILAVALPFFPEELAIEISMLTHNDPRSITAGAVQAYAAEEMFYGHLLRDPEREGEITGYAQRVEEMLAAQYGILAETPMISSILPRVYQLVARGASDELIADSLGVGGAAFESFPTALAFAMKYEDDFRSGVLAGVNAGGDTDTIAALTGALLGARLGFSKLPAEWLEGLEAKDEILALADKFVAVMAMQKKT